MASTVTYIKASRRCYVEIDLVKFRRILNKPYGCRQNEAVLLSGSVRWKSESLGTMLAPCQPFRGFHKLFPGPVRRVKTDILSIFVRWPTGPILISRVLAQFTQAVRASVRKRGCSQFSQRLYRTVRLQTTH